MSPCLREFKHLEAKRCPVPFYGATLTGRRVFEVLHGITLGTIGLTTVHGLKLELERISTPRPEEAAVLHSLRVTLPRPKTRLDRVDVALPENQYLFFEDQQV